VITSFVRVTLTPTEAERDVEEHRLVGELQREDGERLAARERGLRRHAERAPRLVAERDDHQSCHLGERKRHEREVMPGDPEAKARVTDQHRDDDCERDAERDADPRRHAEVVPQHRDHVGADPHERAVAERDEPEAPHQRPAGVDEAPEQDHDQEVQRVLAEAGDRYRGQDRDRDDPGCRTRHHCFPPSSPWGRTNIMTMKNTNAMT
jgi:hypothetical protein